MDIAVSAWSIVKALREKSVTLEDFIDFCAKNGVYNVELLDCFREEDRHYDKIRKKLIQSGVKCCCYAISSDLVCHEPEYTECIQFIKESVDIAFSLGAKNVRIFPGTQKDDISVEDGYAMIISGLKDCCRYAGEKGIMLCMENHGVYGGRSDSLLRIIREVGSDWLGVNPDTGNFLLGGEDPAEAFLHLKGKIGNVHFKDFINCNPGMYESYDGKQQFTGCVLGKGIVPLEKIVAELKDFGYNGCISIEYEGVEPDCMQAVADSIQYSKALL